MFRAMSRPQETSRFAGLDVQNVSCSRSSGHSTGAAMKVNAARNRASVGPQEPSRIEQIFECAGLDAEVTDLIADHEVDRLRQDDARRQLANERDPVGVSVGAGQPPRHVDDWAIVDGVDMPGAGLARQEAQHASAAREVEHHRVRADQEVPAAARNPWRWWTLGQIVPMFIEDE